jgi:hypothetical protein
MELSSRIFANCFLRVPCFVDETAANIYVASSTDLRVCLNDLVADRIELSRVGGCLSPSDHAFAEFLGPNSTSGIRLVKIR